MKSLSKILARCAVTLTATVTILLGVTAPASAQDATLLFGCQVMPGGGGVEVVFADSSSPLRTADGRRLPASSLVGRRCPDAIGLLLDNGLIDRDQLGASEHLVIHSERRTRADGGDDGGTTDVPDCIIWDIDGADVTRVQLVCDPSAESRIVVQESGNTSSPTRNYVGWSCVDALADLGGLANVVRTSVMRPAQAPLRVRKTNRIPFQSGSIILYQFSLAVR